MRKFNIKAQIHKLYTQSYSHFSKFIYVFSDHDSDVYTHGKHHVAELQGCSFNVLQGN